MDKSTKNEALYGVMTYANLMPAFLADVEFRLKSLRANLIRAPVVSDGEQSALVAHLLRNLHTLKATTATYGFISMANLARTAEVALEHFRRPKVGTKFHPLEWAQITSHLENLEISFSEIQVRVRELIPTVDEENQQEVESRDSLPLSTLARRYSEAVLSLESQMGKRLEFQAIPKDLEITPAFFSALDEPVIHLLRNAADHGIEMEALRLLKGKPSTGRIQLIIESNTSGCRITVADDGQGIDPGLVVRKAIDLSLVTAVAVGCMGEKEKLNLIFLPGFTLGRCSVGVSGMGVGLDVVAEWSKARGGYATVDSLVGQGTSITLHLPHRFGNEFPSHFRV